MGLFRTKTGQLSGNQRDEEAGGRLPLSLGRHTYYLFHILFITNICSFKSFHPSKSKIGKNTNKSGKRGKMFIP